MLPNKELPKFHSIETWTNKIQKILGIKERQTRRYGIFSLLSIIPKTSHIKGIFNQQKSQEKHFIKFRIYMSNFWG